jgi:integrase
VPELVPAADADASPALPTETDRERIAEAFVAARSPNTRRAYASAWRGWERFAAERGATTIPAEPEWVAAYIADLAARGRSAATIDTALASISAHHLDAGLEVDPTAHRGVQRARQGLRRKVGTAPKRQAHPLTTDEVRRIVAGIDTSSLRGLRDRAIILLGYAAALRRSEIAALDVADLTWRAKGVVVRLRSSKSDQEAAGTLLGVTRGRHAETDPVSAVRAWIDAAELDGDDPLFTPIAWSDRRAIRRHISGQDVARILETRAAAVGLGDLAISGHSLRAGHATTAAEAGVPAERLMRTTRHKNMATLAQYVRPAEVLRDTSAADLGL